MSMKRLSMFAALLLAGCASESGTTESDHGGGSAVGAVATPFLIALKIPVCLATAVLGGPVAAAAALAHNAEAERAVNEGLSRNCGPPYAIGSAASSAAP
jgi:hypothetical protein